MDIDNNPDFEDDAMEFSADIVTLTDEEGEEHTFELVDTLEKDGISYVALVSYADDPDELLQDDGNLVIMKVVEEDDEEILEILEDDDEFEVISEMFMDRLSDLYDFEESEDD